jgi:hypothetical protein
MKTILRFLHTQSHQVVVFGINAGGRSRGYFTW